MHSEQSDMLKGSKRIVVRELDFEVGTSAGTNLKIKTSFFGTGR